MALLTYLFMGISFYSAIEGKSINIEIDSGDVVKILNGLMSSDAFKNFVTQVIQRSMGKHMTYSNPFHPEDDLVSTFEAAVLQEHKRLKQKKKPKMNASTDALDKENKNFVDDHLSDDVFSDNEVARMTVIKRNITTVLNKGLITNIKPVQLVKATKSPNLINKVNNALVNGKIISEAGMPRVIFEDDRANFKPIQKRFMMKNRKDIDTIT